MNSDLSLDQNFAICLWIFKDRKALIQGQFGMDFKTEMVLVQRHFEKDDSKTPWKALVQKPKWIENPDR